MKNIISEAISYKNIITFEHEGRSHIGEPHAYGTSENGQEYIEVYQINGLYGRWKTLPLDRISKITRLEKLHFEPRMELLPSHNSLVETFCQA